MDRDRNNPMGIGSNTYADAAIIIHEELTVFFGHNYHVNFVSYLLNATIRYFLTVTIQLMNRNNM